MGIYADHIFPRLMESGLKGELHRKYRRWCLESGRPPVSAQAFHGTIRTRYAARAIEKTRNGTRGWAGIKVRES